MGLRAKFGLKICSLSWVRALRQAIFPINACILDWTREYQNVLKGKSKGEGEDTPTKKEETEEEPEGARDRSLESRHEGEG